MTEIKNIKIKKLDFTDVPAKEFTPELVAEQLPAWWTCEMYKDEDDPWEDVFNPMVEVFNHLHESLGYISTEGRNYLIGDELILNGSPTFEFVDALYNLKEVDYDDFTKMEG